MAESDSDDFASAESDTEDLLQTEEEEGGESTEVNPNQDEVADKSSSKSSGTSSDKKDEEEQVVSKESEAHSPPTEAPPPSDAAPSSHMADSPKKPEPPAKTESPSKTEPPSTSSAAPPQAMPTEPSPPSPGSSKVAKEESGKGGGGGWGGWGGWGGSLWSSVSTVAESAQAIGQKVTAVIASVEDSLGVPSPEDLAAVKEAEGGGLDQETCRLADELKEPPADLEPVTEEPHHQKRMSPPAGENAATEQLKEEEVEGEEGAQDSNFRAVSGFFSGFAAAVQNTGQGLVTGGLDALETIGKKTMEVLSEGDPGLTKKRAMLGVGPSPTLSQLLKEAKAEVPPQAVPGEESDSRLPLSYSRLFDEYHGVGHLEALELLSKECAGKTHSSLAGLAEGDFQSLQENWEKLTEAFAIDEEQDNLEDDSPQLDEVKELFSEITLPLKVDKLIKVSSSWREKVERLSEEEKGAEEGGEAKGEQKEQVKQEENKTPPEGEKVPHESEKTPDKTAISETLYENGLRSLAELTSTSIELFRKMAEVSLLPDVSKAGALQQAQKFNRLTVLVSNELDALASVHSEAITELDLEGTNAKVTSLYLESSNSGSYVQDAFQLLLPVLKLSMLQQVQVQEPESNVLNRN